MATRVLFVFSHDEKRTAAQASTISGTVEGGAGCTVRLRAEEPGENSVERFAQSGRVGVLCLQRSGGRQILCGCAW